MARSSTAARPPRYELAAGPEPPNAPDVARCRLPPALPPGPGVGSTPAVEEVQQAQNGMTYGHPRTGVAHHGSNPVPRLRPETVDRAAEAGRLVATERTPFDPLPTVLPQLGALRTETSRHGPVVRPTVHLDHHPHGPHLPSHPTGRDRAAAIDLHGTPRDRSITAASPAASVPRTTCGFGSRPGSPRGNLGRRPPGRAPRSSGCG